MVLDQKQRPASFRLRHRRCAPARAPPRARSHAHDLPGRSPLPDVVEQQRQNQQRQMFGVSDTVRANRGRTASVSASSLPDSRVRPVCARPPYSGDRNPERPRHSICSHTGMIIWQQPGIVHGAESHRGVWQRQAWFASSARRRDLAKYSSRHGFVIADSPFRVDRERMPCRATNSNSRRTSDGSPGDMLGRSEDRPAPGRR